VFIISSLPFPSLNKLSTLTSQPYFRFRAAQNLKIDHAFARRRNAYLTSLVRDLCYIVYQRELCFRDRRDLRVPMKGSCDTVIKQLRTNDKGWSCCLVVGVHKSPTVKNNLFKMRVHEPPRKALVNAVTSLRVPWSISYSGNNSRITVLFIKSLNFVLVHQTI
jgi:hypothetical protein